MKVKACVIQDNPVFFNKEATLRKVEALTKQYAGEGAQLIVFPESFIPGYPRGFWRYYRPADSGRAGTVCGVLQKQHRSGK